MISLFQKKKPVEAQIKTEMKPFTSVNLLSDIAHNICIYGEHKPKKHGEWVCLVVGEYFFQMDTWNGAISYKKGIPQYEYWTGFSGEHQEYLGLSDAAWRANDPLPLSFEKYENYLLIIHEYMLKYLHSKETTT